MAVNTGWRVPHMDGIQYGLAGLKSAVTVLTAGILPGQPQVKTQVLLHHPPPTEESFRS